MNLKKLKIASWNVNGIRACTKKGFLEWLQKEAPDICCLQETKSQENDTGKNTGGMGAYSPSRLFNEKLEQKILEKIIKPTLKGFNN